MEAPGVKSLRVFCWNVVHLTDITLSSVKRAQGSYRPWKNSLKLLRTQRTFFIVVSSF